MIEKNRLIQLMKEEKTVYCCDEDIKLKKEYIDSFKENSYIGFLTDDERIWEYDELYEDKRRAVHNGNYEDVLLEIWLNLPFFDDLEEPTEIKFINPKSVYSHFELYVNDKEILVQEFSRGDTSCITYFKEPLTEENYEKACRLCVNLFCGTDEIPDPLHS